MKLLKIFILSFFISTTSFAENLYVMDNSSPGAKDCFQVIKDFDVIIKDAELFGIFEDAERLESAVNQGEYISYYYGYELGVAQALNQPINSAYSRAELSKIFVDTCKERKFGDTFFTILPEIYKIKNE